MHFSHSFFLAILPLLTAAIPLAQPRTPRGITIPIAKRAANTSHPLADPSRYESLNQNTIAKIQRGMAAYQKNTGSPHPLLGGITTSNKRDTGSVSLTDYYDDLWYGTISVGTPPKNYLVDFDTGSSDLFLPSTSCDSSCSGHTLYDPSTSSTARDLGQNFSLAYGDGSTVSGKEYSDKFSIAGLVACEQAVGAAETYSTGFQKENFPADGLMGMGFQSISVYNAPPPVQNLISENQLTSPMFGFKFASSGSELVIGGIDPSYKIDDFTWVPVTQQGYWQASFDAITIDKLPVLGLENVTAIFDTGTTLIVGDPARIAYFFEMLSPFLSSPAMPLPGNPGLYSIPCDFNTPISVYVGGKKIAISPDTFNLGALSSGSNQCLAGAAWLKELTGRFWILGDVFLRNTYTAWDVGTGNKARIGFADLV